MALLLEIVTPEKKAFSDPVETLTLPTTKGEIGILPGHIPLVAELLPGELAISQNGRTEYLAVDRGFVSVSGDKVSVLTEAAVDIQAIDLSIVEKAQARAETALQAAKDQQEIHPDELERLEQVVRFSVAQKLVKGAR